MVEAKVVGDQIGKIMLTTSESTKLNPWETLTNAVVDSQDKTQVVLDKEIAEFQEFEKEAKMTIVALRNVNTQLQLSIASLKELKGTLADTHNEKTKALYERIAKLQEQMTSIQKEQEYLKNQIKKVQEDSRKIQANIDFLQSPAGQEQIVDEIRRNRRW